MLVIFISLLIFVGMYSIARFLLYKVNGIGELVDVLSICIGILAALFYAGAL
jgi:hypothetical protein